MAAQQEQAKATHKIKIRYRTGIKADMRVLFQGRPFYLMGPPINPEERRIELHMVCEERAE